MLDAITNMLMQVKLKPTQPEIATLAIYFKAQGKEVFCKEVSSQFGRSRIEISFNKNGVTIRHVQPAEAVKKSVSLSMRRWTHRFASYLFLAGHSEQQGMYDTICKDWYYQIWL